jgi:hypothetical protein
LILTLVMHSVLALKFCWEFEILPKRKFVPFEFIFYLAKFAFFGGK